MDMVEKLDHLAAAMEFFEEDAEEEGVAEAEDEAEVLSYCLFTMCIHVCK